MDDLASDDVESSIVTLISRLSSATFDLLVLIGEFDVRGTWALRGALSCAAWLAATCDIEMVTARNQVRAAQAMRDHPARHAAMATGDVSFSKARMLIPHLSDANATYPGAPTPTAWSPSPPASARPMPPTSAR